MKTSVVRNSQKSGLPPGALIHIGNKKTEQIKLSKFTYNENDFEEIVFKSSKNIETSINNDIVTWINLDGIHNTKVIENIGQYFNLHGLLLEDILNTNHRPKAEYFEDHMIFSLKMLGVNETGDNIISEQVSIVLGKNYLISFQEQEGDLFEPIRDRIRTKKGKIRLKKSDYLFYALTDTIVDNYYLIIENFSERVEKLEEKVLTSPDENTLREIQELKKQLSTLRKAVYPLREAVSTILKDEEDFFHNDNSIYLRDVYDHIIHILDSLESQRDVVAGLKDLYMSELSNRMNSTMKVLTIIATIFIPLTFIAGIYGMNFDHMPELHYRWGYPAIWALMILITIGMIIYFKKKKWL
ncbi:MAG: magnesium/cobalt transporter CorA [Vicingaceae bacterium]|nr:magnesium/cobalt transporter CorA [Vicingaceae bacterium]